MHRDAQAAGQAAQIISQPGGRRGHAMSGLPRGGAWCGPLIIIIEEQQVTAGHRDAASTGSLQLLHQGGACGVGGEQVAVGMRGRSARGRRRWQAAPGTAAPHPTCVLQQLAKGLRELAGAVQVQA